jgi:hypothetical protein
VGGTAAGGRGSSVLISNCLSRDVFLAGPANLETEVGG